MKLCKSVSWVCPFDDAKDTPIADQKNQDKVDKEIAKAEEELAKAEDKPGKAIDHYRKAWEHAQHAEKTKAKSKGLISPFH